MRAVQSTGTFIAAAFRSIRVELRSRVVRLTKVLRNRRDLELLAGADDRMLRDIGLTRSDLRSALSVPLWRDPAHVLSGPARSRATEQRRRSSVPSIAPARGSWSPQTSRLPRPAG